MRVEGTEASFHGKRLYMSKFWLSTNSQKVSGTRSFSYAPDTGES